MVSDKVSFTGNFWSLNWMSENYENYVRNAVSCSHPEGVLFNEETLMLVPSTRYQVPKNRLGYQVYVASGTRS